MKLVDAVDSKSTGSDTVPVRVRPWAPFVNKTLFDRAFFLVHDIISIKGNIMTKKDKKRMRKIIILTCFIVLCMISFSMIKTHFFQTTHEHEEEYIFYHDYGLKDKDIETMLNLSYYRPERAKRYAKWPQENIEKRVLEVNCDMDLEPFEMITVVKDDQDMTMLINKFNSLPQDYMPNDLVPVKEYVCVQGQDYSCQAVAQIELRQEVAQAYLDFAKAAEKEGIQLRLIAGYRSYAYQKGLWEYAANTQGQDYADTYYARPGQSEHNSGLCLDLTFNGYRFNEIEKYEGYDWILENAPQYGFILRYPEDKVDVTRYSYESWHFRYVGKKVAQIIDKNHWTLEEYHGYKK